MKNFLDGLVVLLLGAMIGAVLDFRLNKQEHRPVTEIRYLVPASCTKTVESAKYVEFICAAGDNLSPH